MPEQAGPGRLIVLAGGGTGGHLTPGLAVAEVLQERGTVSRVQLFGTERPVEAALLSAPCSEAVVDHIPLPAEPVSQLRRRPFRFLWNNVRAIGIAARRFRYDRPAAVVGLGGFASAPVVLAARRCRVPVVLLEQNLVPGRTTRWLSRLAHLVCLSFEETRLLLPADVRAIVTGNPVRASVRRAGSHRQPAPIGGRLSLMVLGGSQGAAALNRAVPQALQAVRDRLPDLQIVHQTGSEKTGEVRRAYAAVDVKAIVRPFLADVPDWLVRADLVISRAGATTLAELACMHVPALLVPYPQAADDHQWQNARFFERAGAATVVRQTEGDHWIDRLAEALATLATRSFQRRRMSEAMARLARPEAAERVAELVRRMVSPASETDRSALSHRPHIAPVAKSAASHGLRAD